MKLISRSQFPFRGQGGITVSEGDEFYIDGDTPEKDLSQRGKEFLGNLRSGNQFLYPDTQEAVEFLSKLAERRNLEVEKNDAKAREERGKKNANKNWYEKPGGIVFLGVTVTVIGLIITAILCHWWPTWFHF